jgi:hypothetical protein
MSQKSRTRVERRGSNAVGNGCVGLALLLGALFGAQPAQAESVVLAETGLIVGGQTADFSMDLPGPGTVSIELTDLGWAMPLSSLTFSITTANSVLDSMSGPGNSTFNVSSGGAYFAHVGAQAQGALDLGVYSLDVLFNPQGSMVALPASIWLLLGGLVAVASLAQLLSPPPAENAAAPVG